MASEAPAPSGGGTILGLRPRTALIAGGVILAGALAWFWWKRRQQSSSGSAASSSSASSSSSTYGYQNQWLADELEQLMAGQGQDGTGSPGASPAPGTGTAAGTAPKTGTAATATRTRPATPSGVHETKVTSASVTLAWDKVPDATAYRVRVTYQGKLVGGPHLTAATSATVSGLAADRTYTFHVAATGPGGTSAETNGPAVKTARS